jgi:hypothetical protein
MARAWEVLAVCCVCLELGPKGKVRARATIPTKKSGLQSLDSSMSNIGAFCQQSSSIIFSQCHKLTCEMIKRGGLGSRGRGKLRAYIRDSSFKQLKKPVSEHLKRTEGKHISGLFICLNFSQPEDRNGK